MKKLVLMISALMACMVVGAANVVTIEYNGATATVTIPGDLAAYVTCSSGTSSHVQLVQSDAVADGAPGEITYQLSGSSDDGGFEMKGSYKCTVKLMGVTLNNPSGPAINVDNGKRIELNANKDGGANTLSDGANGDWKACVYTKGHFELKGKGTLNIVGNTAHAISSKEYMQVKNLTLNITGAKKDGIHCKQYFWMQSGTITIKGAEDDGIQVELDGKTSTGILPDHEDTDADIDEDTGNCYLDDGTLTIKDLGKSAIKTDGQVIISGGKQDYDTNAVSENNNPATAITVVRSDDTRANDTTGGEMIYNVTGRQLKDIRKGQIVIIRHGSEVRKVIIK
ncbi:MAG: carbohydrate-binding domain-containing protein [Prevotella sp.]|nr:carbohydrate-binding domain-containing protein [Prevotella sp.]